MSHPPPFVAAPAGDSQSDIPQIHDPISGPNVKAAMVDTATQTDYPPLYIPVPPPRVIPPSSPFFRVLRTAYEKADASLVCDSLLSWPEKYLHPEPSAILFGLPGTEGICFNSLRQLDHDAARRMEIVCRGARAAGWDVFFASVRALWSGPTISKPYQSFLRWPDHDPESGLFEHLRCRDLTSALFDVEIMSVYDLDGEVVLPPWAHDHHATRFSLLHTVHGLIHEELFRNQPDAESPVQPGLGQPDRKWTQQTWYRDTVLLIPQAQSPYVLSSAVVAPSPWPDHQIQNIAKYFLGLALENHTGFPKPSLTVHNAYLVVDMLYQVMTTASWGSLNAEAMMTPVVKSQILMLAGEQCDHALFLRACTRQSAFDSAPDHQSFIPWLHRLVKSRRLMNFWAPHLNKCLIQVILSYENMHDRVMFALNLPKQISGQHSLPYLLASSWLKPLLIPDDLRTSALCSLKDGEALAKAALRFDSKAAIVQELITAVVNQMQLPTEPMPWIAGFIKYIGTNIFTHAARIGRLGEPICAALLKQWYRILVKPVQGRLNCPQDLSRKPSQPVDPRDHIAMEGYRFLVDASQETARFRWTALERDLAQWLWKDTRVSTSLDTSTQPPTLVVKKRSTSNDNWLERRKMAAKSCAELEEIRHSILQYDPAYSGLLTARDLVDWSFAEGTGPDPAWVSEYDPADPSIEEPYTPRRPTLARIVSPGSSPTCASPAGSTVTPRNREPDQDRDNKIDSESKELDKAQALKSLTLEEYLKRRARMKLKGRWDQLHEEDEEDLQELYLLLGRRKSLSKRAYITEEKRDQVDHPSR
ncbi:hypothetical protein B0T13DRAFT_441178 [Neurospora crassa]|nr:hypothetical protein B0T13DRAFT_441178 [Neurospora crassa]